MTDPIFSELERKLTRDSLRYAVGRAIFCPGCGTILDCRRAVELDFYRGNDLAGVKVVCASCYDAKMGDGKLEGQLEGTGLTVKALDGRELFGRKKKQKAA
jgi:hypothetical protein